jgi:hypothetical protein
MLKIAAGLFAVIAGCAAARAAELAPMQAKTIALGDLTGVAYYTAAADGYRVVATLAAGEAASPFRVVVTLVPGQKIVISIPQAVGQPAKEVEFARIGDAIAVSESGATNTAMK